MTEEVNRWDNFSTWDIEDDPFPAPDSSVEWIDHFDARGMRLVFGRGDHFAGGKSMHIDVWLSKQGRLLARFWSRYLDTDGMSWEIFGFSPDLLLPDRSVKLDARWVPQCLRDEYDEWVKSEG